MDATFIGLSWSGGLHQEYCHYSESFTFVDKPLHYIPYLGGLETPNRILADRFWVAGPFCQSVQGLSHFCVDGGPDGDGFVDYIYYKYYLYLFCLQIPPATPGYHFFPFADSFGDGELCLAVVQAIESDGRYYNDISGQFDADVCDGTIPLGSCADCMTEEFQAGDDEGSFHQIRTTPWVTHAIRVCSCDPFDVEFGTSYFGGTFRVRAPGAADSPCGSESTPCDPGCWAIVRYIERCPESCTPGATYSVHDPVDDATYGPFPWEYEVIDGNCVQRSATARVCAPESGARDYDLIDHGAGDATIATLTVSDCVGETEVVGDVPGTGTLVVCVTGCPDGELMAGVAVGATILDGDGLAIGTGAAGTDLDGCASINIRFPEAAGEYDVLVVIAPTAAGYKASETTIADVEFPATSFCGGATVEAGTVAAPLADDYVCTCAGPARKCLDWSGNGDPIQLDYVAASDPPRWVGVERTTSEYDYASDGLCNGFGGGEAATVVELEIGPDGEGGCKAEARRFMWLCDCPAPAEKPDSPCYRLACDEITPRTMTAEPGVDPLDDPGPQQSRSILPLTAWGPDGDMPTLTFGGAFQWTRPDGTPDTDLCFAPEEAYATGDASTGTAASCDGGAGLMMAAAPTAGPSGIPDEPPLPSKLRMAGQLARTMAATAARAARGGPIRASEATQEARWSECRSCPSYRPSDRRCGSMTGCGCHLSRKIPLAGSRCPLGRWGPEPVNPPPPPGTG